MLPEQWDLFFESLWHKLRRRKHLTISTSTSPAPPWDNWELDPKFFKTLSRWTRDNPEKSIDRVLGNVCAGFENVKEIMQLVPDSPFPARSLIGALACLVKLSVTISKAQRDVQAFANEIVRWVDGVRSAFEQGGRGYFNLQTRKNLMEMRALIDEICRWANARLNDGRWSRIGHGLTITKEIDEFQSRISKAKALFMDLTVIKLSQGQDTIIQDVRNLTITIQQTQTKQLSRILHELDAQQQAEARRQFLSQILSEHVVANTAYNDQGKRPCDSDTRIDVLEDIRQWVNDISDHAKSFLWLTGNPGSGKSAITASVARECKDLGVLWAQFFINRNIVKTTNPAFYFPSIARQLADHSPDVALAIHDILKEQPSLMDDISPSQAGNLFVKSLKVASSIDSSKPVVVIIDGLDETDASRLRYTAEIFSQALVDLPRNTKVFISSRTEDDIRKPFTATFHVEHSKHVHLDTSAESSIRDVSTFLTRNIVQIVERNGLDILEWPGEERMRALCNQASGLFIWAVTAIKFIQELVDAEGKECLNQVFDELNISGMGDINVLYGTILRLTHQRENDPWAFERFRRIVGCIVVLKKPLCLSDITSLLDLRNPKSHEAVDIEHHVRRLRTVLVAGTDAIDGQTVPRLHKSFYEFITSERADHRFRINVDASHGAVAMQCLRQLAGSRMERDNKALTRNDRFLGALRYACEFWTLHLPSGMMAGVTIVGSLQLHELQELCRCPNGNQSLPVHVAFSADKQLFFSSLHDEISVWDANSGTRIKFPAKGHTGPVSCVAFSPDGKHVISASWDNTLRLWDARSGQAIGSPLNGAQHCVAFSPDGHQVISGMEDHSLQMWDARSGQCIGSPFKGHTGLVQSVAFSPDGERVISASADHTLILWDARSGQHIGSPLRGHTSIVRSVVFSPDGHQVVSGSRDDTLRFWDARSRQPSRSPLTGHADSVWCIAFAPDGKQIVSGSLDNTLRLWDAHSGEPIGSPFRGHTAGVVSVAFSPNGKQVISGSYDHTLLLWDAQGGQPIGSPFRGHTSGVVDVAFSPNGKQIISGSLDMTLRLWDVASCQQIEFSFEGHTDRVISISLSPDGSIIVSGSLDNSVRVWDTRTGQLIGSPLTQGTNAAFTVIFSQDGNQFVTCSSDGNVCLWDTASRSLLASYRKEHIDILTRIVFSSDGRHLVAFRIDGSTHTWDVTNGRPAHTSQSSDAPLTQSSQPFSLDVKRGWIHEETDEAAMRCYPVNDSYFSYWAYIDGKIIRNDQNGLTTIIDTRSSSRQRTKVTKDSQRKDRSGQTRSQQLIMKGGRI